MIYPLCTNCPMYPYATSSVAYTAISIERNRTSRLAQNASCKESFGLAWWLVGDLRTEDRHVPDAGLLHFFA